MYVYSTIRRLKRASIRDDQSSARRARQNGGEEGTGERRCDYKSMNIKFGTLLSHGGFIVCSSRSHFFFFFFEVEDVTYSALSRHNGTNCWQFDEQVRWKSWDFITATIDSRWMRAKYFLSRFLDSLLYKFCRSHYPRHRFLLAPFISATLLRR